jgi:hypothetical protein
MFHIGLKEVPGSEFQVPGSEFQVPGSEFQVPGSQISRLSALNPNSEFRITSSCILRRFWPQFPPPVQDCP